MTNLSGANLNNGSAVGPQGEGMDSPSSFPAYPAYKDSGVEWLGGLPQHWRFGCLKHALIELISGGTPESSNPAYWADGDGVPWVAISDMTKGLVINDTAKTITEDGLRSKGLRVIPAGGLLYSIYASIGKVAVLGLSAVTNQAILGLVVNGAVADQQFVRWWLVSLEGWVKTVSSSNTQDNLNAEKVRNLPLAFPSLTEQTQIARFLDHETARIDALIEEQQRLIELLKEKRQAVISHAVTKGLDPTVPMKDSGVEWLGEVPAHWDVGTLRWYATIQGGVAKGKDYEGRETVVMPYLRVANVQNGYVDLAEVKEIAVLESEVERYRLRAGDVLMNEGGDNDKLGRGTVWQAQIDPCLHQNHVFAIRPNGLLNAEWLATFTQSEQARTYFFLNSKQSTNLASISASNVMSLALPIPSVSEQQQIIAYLEEDRSSHEQLTEVAISTVELLQERRSALISAAVTGKIDVRGWQPPASSQTSEYTPPDGRLKC